MLTALKMEEMDHETSVNIDAERPSTPVNVYGLPVEPHCQRNEESVASTSHFVSLLLVNVKLFQRLISTELIP